MGSHDPTARFPAHALAAAPTDSRQAAPDRRNRLSRERLVARIRAEFHDAPGLCLTLAQGARLFGVTHETCARVFDTLMAARFLTLGADGRYKLR